MLPRHDDIGLQRQILEAIYIAGAAVLLLAHWCRFFLAFNSSAWWALFFVPLGMAVADLLSGLVHWAADTWGNVNMPVLGRRLLHPFRVHHINPDDFLHRSFLDANGDVAMLMLPVLVGMFWVPFDTAAGHIAAACLLGFCSVGVWTNQIHQWAHRRRPPLPVRLLQGCHIILSHTAHQRHHCSPHDTDYCIATGWCNGPLQRIGFFRRLERAVTWLTGIVPRDDELSFQTAIALALGASPREPAESE